MGFHPLSCVDVGTVFCDTMVQAISSTCREKDKSISWEVADVELLPFKTMFWSFARFDFEALYNRLNGEANARPVGQILAVFGSVMRWTW